MVAKLKVSKLQTQPSHQAFNSVIVDAGFDNPNTAAPTYDGTGSTYGVAGGSTALTGEKILARVAIAKPASGTIYTATTSTTGYGMVTSLSDISANSAIGTTDGLDIGKVSAVNSGILLAITNTVATGSFVVTSGNVSTTGGLGSPVWFDETIGNLIVNTPYFIKSIANTTHFTVSATEGGGAVAMATTNGITANLNQSSVTFSANASQAVRGASFVVADNAAGYVLRQKGKRKFLVADASDIQDEDIIAGQSYVIKDVSGTDWAQFGAGPDAANGKVFTATINGSAASVDNGVVNMVGVCKTANLGNTALTVNTMNLLATKTSGTAYLDSMTSKHGIDFTDNGTDQNAGTHFYASTNGAVAASESAGRPFMVVDVRTA